MRLFLGLLAAACAFGEAPSISGVANAASGVPRVARGSLASIYGSNLAAGVAQPGSLPLPIILAGVTVTVGGINAPLVYVSPTQINVQVPFDVASVSSLSVIVTRDGIPSASVSVPRDEYVPGIFQYARTSSAFDPIIVHASTNQLVTPTNPATPNEALVIYATGIGALNNVPRSGVATPLSPLASSVDPVTVTVGGNAASVSFAGLTPGFVGLIQINIQLNATAPSSSCPALVVQVAGASSPPVNLSVAPSGCSTAPAGTPAISTTPATLDFGSVTPGQTSSLVLTVRNTGTATLMVRSIASNNPRFSVSPVGPFLVVANGLAAVTVQFAPDAPGAQSGTLTLVSDDPARPSVVNSVTGIGTGPLAPVLTVAATLDFGPIAVGQTSSLPLILRNTGTATLSVATVNTNSQRFSPASFATAIQVAAGGQVMVNVLFAPLVVGAQNATLTILSNDPVHPSVTVQATGSGTGGTPVLILDPAALDFGGVAVGQTKEMSVAVRNNGSAALIISEIDLTTSTDTSAFSVSSTTPITVAPGSQTPVVLKFQPLMGGPFTGAIFLTTNDPANSYKKVPVTGIGILP